MTIKILAVAFGGALGALFRFGIGEGVARWAPGVSLPWATFTANSLGCLLIGLLWPIVTERYGASSAIGALIFVGFLGALTTFSTYAFEGLELARADAQWLRAGLWVVGQNVVGFLAVGIGWMAGAWWIGNPSG